MSSDQDIIDTIAAHDCWDYAGGLECRCGAAFYIVGEGMAATKAAWGRHVLTALRSAGYEVVARPESLPLAALHEAMVAYDAYPSENAEDDYNPCMRVLDAARDLLDAEKAEEK